MGKRKNKIEKDKGKGGDAIKEKIQQTKDRKKMDRGRDKRKT